MHGKLLGFIKITIFLWAYFCTTPELSGGTVPHVKKEDIVSKEHLLVELAP